MKEGDRAGRGQGQGGREERIRERGEEGEGGEG